MISRWNLLKIMYLKQRMRYFLNGFPSVAVKDLDIADWDIFLGICFSKALLNGWEKDMPSLHGRDLTLLTLRKFGSMERGL